MNNTIRKGVDTFLTNRSKDSPYLIPKWYPNLESQYIVHPGSNPSEDNSNKWTDGEQEWSHHRWPHKAGTNPTYKDRKLTFCLGTHMKRFGSTWWDFKKLRSVAVALDIDLEGEHAESTTTVTKTKLDELIKMLSGLDYITLVRSSGGGGVHIYSFFEESDQPESQNHNEHSQVAQALVAKISDDLGYNLRQHMDAVGVVFWLWSCDSGEDHRGYELIKEQTAFLGSKDIRDYLDVNLAGPNREIKITGYTEDGKKVVNSENGGGYKVYELEPAHSSILKELEDIGFSFIWQPGHNMAHTHTAAIKALYDKRAEDGKPLSGIFTTVSKGTDKSKPNCYMTPRPGGVFQVKRFGTGTSETPLWHTRDGDTWCYFNQDTPVLPVLKKFCSSYDGVKLVFEAANLELAMKSFGKTLGESIEHINVPITVILNKSGVITAKFKGSGSFKDWNNTKEGFQRDLPLVHKESDYAKTLLDESDQVVRHILTPDLDPYGWAIKSRQDWIIYTTYDPISCYIKQMFGKDAEKVHSEMLVNPWVLHHHPFGKEYPGDRLWNKTAPQFSIDPSSNPGPHPHWDLVMDHLGNSLDSTVANTTWCQQWGVHTGADYLKVWVSALVRDPMESLPYLFFYGPQNSGKSSFHESIARLFTRGVTSASTAISSGGGFNAELSNAVMGFIEEKDLSTAKDSSYARIKEWITARTILIHTKGHTPYQQQNTLHLIHLANRPGACPMEDGDTRITAILVNPLPSPIPRKTMERALENEKANFLRTILTLNLPESPTRLRVPMLATEHKHALEEMNQTPFESFCVDHLIICEGHSVKFQDFYRKYSEYCNLRSNEPERKNHILQLLRNRGDKYLIGIGPGKQNHIANCTLDPGKKPKSRLILNPKGRLVHV